MIRTSWLALSLAVITLLLLGWQGAVLVERKAYSSRFGRLTLFLTVLGAFFQASLLTGGMLFGDELRVWMSEGSLLRIMMKLLLFCGCLAAGWGWWITLPDDNKKWLRAVCIFSLAAVVGLIATMHVRLLNPGASEQLQVSTYDLLSPLVILWLILCLTQVLAIMLQVPYLKQRALISTVAFFAISFGVSNVRLFSDPMTPQGWEFVGPGSLAVSVMLLTWIAIVRVPAGEKLRRSFYAFFGILASAAAGALRYGKFSSGVSIVCWIIAIATFGGHLGMTFPWRSLNKSRIKAVAFECQHQVLPRLVRLIQQFGRDRSRQLRRNWILLAVLFISFGALLFASYLATHEPRFRLIGLSTGPILDSSVELSAVIFSWIILIELFGMGPLTANSSATFPLEYESEASPLQHALRGLASYVKRSFIRSKTLFSTFSKNRTLSTGPSDKSPSELTKQSESEEKTDTGTEGVIESLQDTIKATSGGWGATLSKVAIGVALLVAVSEIPNAHKTIVQPFEAPETLGKTTGREVSEEIIANLDEMSNYFKFTVVGLKPSGTASGGSFTAPTNDGVQSSGADTVGNANNLSLPGGFKVPLNFLLLPVQAPTRWLLGVRVINGSMHSTGTEFMLLATSNDGEAWSQIGSGTSDTVIPELSRKIAFAIAAGDPAFNAVGMGTKWDAYQPFKDGVDANQRFEANGTYKDLSDSIKFFRAAVESDSDFALAYYRLGLSLESDGDPAGAVAALRNSISANRKFVPGYVALASALQGFDDFRFIPPAIIANEPFVSGDTPPQPSIESESRNVEARAVWEQVATLTGNDVQLTDLAAAYYGLCSTVPNQDPNRVELQYFYCRRAEQFYARMPSAAREATTNRKSEAAAINLLGLVLFRDNNSPSPIAQRLPIDPKTPIMDRHWVCSSESITLPQDSHNYDTDHFELQPFPRDITAKENVWNVPRIRQTARYFNLAHTLLPDDEDIACNSALAAYSIGNSTPMRVLEAKTSSRYYLGTTFMRMGREQKNSAYYLLAMREFREVLDRDPDNLWALNNFAYSFWQYKISHPWTAFPKWFKSEAWLGAYIGSMAEWAAKRAQSIVESSNSEGDKVQIRSTVGEVLIAQGRPEEAIEVIRNALDALPPEATKNANYDEARYDLSQAYLCDSYFKNQVLDPHGKAAALLSIIAANAGRRNDDSWLNRAYFFDPHLFSQRACEVYIDDMDFDPIVHFSLASGSPTYSTLSTCQTTELAANVPQASGEESALFKVRVWGGQFGTWLDLHSGHAVLSFGTRDSKQYYFGQLFKRGKVGSSDLNYRPVSAAYPVETFASKTRCRNNLISLTFIQSTDAPAFSR